MFLDSVGCVHENSMRAWEQDDYDFREQISSLAVFLVIKALNFKPSIVFVILASTW